MNDPHVDSLHYRFVVADERHDYSEASAWDGPLGDFDVHLHSDELVATPRVHLASEDEARARLEPLLGSWEIRSDLEDGIPIRFVFSNADVVDRDPAPGHVTLHVHAAGSVSVAGEVTLRANHRAFPQPSDVLLIETQLVSDLRELVHEVRSGSQRLLVGVYLFLTRLEYEFGSRTRAATGVAVSEQVLRKLGELSVVNDPTARRKVFGPERLLTDAERRWLDKALRRIVLHIAGIEGGGTPAQLTTADLPPL